MTKSISEDNKEQIILLKLQGFSNREVAEKTGTSPGTVTNVMNEFTRRTGESPEDVIKFNRILRGQGIKVSDLVPISALYGVIKRSGLDSDDTSKFLQDVYTRCKEQGVEPKDLVESSKTLFDLQSLTKMEIQELPKYCTTLGADVARLSQEVEDLKNEEKQAKQDLESVLSQKNTTIAQLNEYQSIKNGLDRVDVSISDVKQLSTMLVQAKQDHFEIKQIRQYLQEQRGIKNYIKTLESRKIKLDLEIESRSKQSSDIYKKLQSDTNKYNHLSNLFSIVQGLLERGVTPGAIYDWNNILDSSGVSSRELLQSISKYAGLKGAINEKEQEISSIEKRAKLISSEIEALETKKASLEAYMTKSLHTHIESIKKLYESEQSTIEDLYEKSEQEITQLSQNVKNDWHELNYMTTTGISSLVLQLKNEIQSMQDASEEFGRMDALRPIFEIITGKDVPKEQGCTAIMLILSKIKEWDKLKNACNIKNYLTNAESQLGLHLVAHA